MNKITDKDIDFLSKEMVDVFDRTRNISEIKKHIFGYDPQMIRLLWITLSEYERKHMYEKH